MMRWQTIVLWCLVGTLNGNEPLTAQVAPVNTEEIGVPGTPVTNERVEAGLRKNREVLRRSPKFQTQDAPTHLRLAEILSQQGDPNGAIEEYRAAIQLNPEMADAFRGLGAVYNDKHEWGKAEQALRNGTKLNPHDHQTFFWLGRSLIAQEHFPQAQEALATAAQLDPKIRSHIRI
jgi:cytochrome c-type biogenesis protein CcmH/NrfG